MLPARLRSALGPHCALWRLDGVAAAPRDEPRDGRDPRRVDAGGDVVVVGPDPEGHDELLARRVAGGLAAPVPGGLALARAPLDGGERAGDGEPEIVVAVDGEGHALEPGAAPPDL